MHKHLSTMKQLLLLFSVIVSSVAFSQHVEDYDTLLVYGKSTDKTWGKKIQNPVKLGFGRLPLHINRYLNNLTDEEGKHIKFMKIGSETVADQKTPISIYFIEMSGNKFDTLYFDNYHWETPKLLMGYGWKERREEYYGEYANDTDTLGTGKGTYFYSDGKIYRGLWKNGKREGFGRLYYAESSPFEYEEGYFVDDKQKGKFKLVNREGNISSKDY